MLRARAQIKTVIYLFQPATSVWSCSLTILNLSNVSFKERSLIKPKSCPHFSQSNGYRKIEFVFKKAPNLLIIAITLLQHIYPKILKMLYIWWLLFETIFMALIALESSQKNYFLTVFLSHLSKFFIYCYDIYFGSKILARYCGWHHNFEYMSIFNGNKEFVTI